MAKCKAITLSGLRCRNTASPGQEYCYLHSKHKRNEHFDSKDNQNCSFCAKSVQEVRKLITGSGVFICDECVNVCIDLITDGGNDFNSLPFLEDHLKQKIEIEQNIEALGIKPRFKKLKFEKRINHCFLLCPFSEPYNSIYLDHLKPTVEKSGFSIERADDIYGTQPIIEDIWEQINSAEIVIADVTGKNPNVMYEIGMAHTVGRPVVIITQDISDVPFDLKHYRCIIYDYTPRGVNELQRQIEGTLRFIKKSNHP